MPKSSSGPRALPDRIGPLIAGAALMLVVGSFGLSFVAAERSSATEGLGYSGDTLRIVATADTGSTPFVGSQQLTTAVTEFATEQQMSVAFSASNAPADLTLLDPDARFTVADPALLGGLVPGDGRGAALASTSVAEADRLLLVPDGVALTGLFTPTAAFDGQYPAVLLDVDAAPFTSGIFLFAGRAVQDTGPVTDLFARNGMEVLDATVYEAVTLEGAVASRYGVFALVLGGIAAIAGLLTVHIHAALGRRRLIAAAVLGATRRELRLQVVRRSAPQVLAGTGVGTVAYLAGVLVARELLLAPTSVAALAVLAATGVCATVWVVILGWVSEWETWRCRRVVAC